MSKKILIVIIIVLITTGLIYGIQYVIPKYQVYAIREEDKVLIIKLNTITGDTNTWYRWYGSDPFDKYR